MNGKQTEYKMDHTHRGHAVIFNHVHRFVNSKPRKGSIEDARRLKRALKSLKFSVEVHTDLTCSGVKNTIDELARQDYSDYDCMLVAVLTHGGEMDHTNFQASDGEYDHAELWRPFVPDRCPTLAGKPKLFFFQACRGKKTDSGYSVKKQNDLIKHVPDAGYRTGPLMADFLMAYSSALGYVSWRNPEAGSWFIQSLCEVLENHAELDLQTILTRVHNKVSEFECEKDNIINRQVPQVVHTLTYDLFLLQNTPLHVKMFSDGVENSSISKKKGKNQMNKNSENIPLAEPGARLASRSQEDQHDVFARNVAMKLRQIEKNKTLKKQRLYVEKIINDAISRGELGKLKDTSQITEPAVKKRKLAGRGALRGRSLRSSTSSCPQLLSLESGPGIETETGGDAAE